MQPDALGPTAPAHPPPPSVAPSEKPPMSVRAQVASAAAVGLLAGLLIGILLGRAGSSGSAAPALTPQEPRPLAQLGVTSKPVEANVVVDGRFVGVSPVERIDLDPGKHSIVIDSFGYQPYAGTVEVDANARATLKVVLAPIGARDVTNGEVVGVKKSSNVAIPPTALAPISMTGTGTSKDGAKPAGTAASSSSRPRPPAAPRRDCSGERSRCRENCSSTNFSCTSACTGCGSCSTNWDECNRQCSTCRQGCEQNVKFCESSCESNYSSCQ